MLHSNEQEVTYSQPHFQQATTTRLPLLGITATTTATQPTTPFPTTIAPILSGPPPQGPRPVPRWVLVPRATVSWPRLVHSAPLAPTPQGDLRPA